MFSTRRRAVGEAGRIYKFLSENWFRIGVFAFTVTVGWLTLKTRVDALETRKVDQKVFDDYVYAEAVRAVKDSVRDAQIVTKLDNIIAIQCIGLSRAPGCLGVRR